MDCSPSRLLVYCHWAVTYPARGAVPGLMGTSALLVSLASCVRRHGPLPSPLPPLPLLPSSLSRQSPNLDRALSVTMFALAATAPAQDWASMTKPKSTRRQGSSMTSAHCQAVRKTRRPCRSPLAATARTVDIIPVKYLTTEKRAITVILLLSHNP